MQQARFRGFSRLGRAAALGAAALGLTLTAHTAAAATLPAPLEIGLLLPLALALGYAASDRRRSLTWLTASVLAVQVLFHVLLIATGSHLNHQSWVPAPNMLICHLLAALALAWVITQGENTLARWGNYLAQVIGRSAAPVHLHREWLCPIVHSNQEHTELATTHTICAAGRQHFATTSRSPATAAGRILRYPSKTLSEKGVYSCLQKEQLFGPRPAH